MKRCRWVRKDIVAYANGELDGREARAVERHLAVCAACAALCREEKRIEELLASELGALRKTSHPRLSWESVKPSIEREAARTGAAHRASRVWESLWTGVREMVFPTAARQFSEMMYWGKRVTVPALGFCIAVALFHIFQRTPDIAGGRPMESAPSQIVINIRFAPDGASVNGRCFRDSGGRFSINQGSRGDLRYGWK